MSIVNAKEIMIPAAKEGWAVGAFNVTDLLQFEAVIDAAIEKRTPVIVQTSVKPSQFLEDIRHHLSSLSSFRHPSSLRNFWGLR